MVPWWEAYLERLDTQLGPWWLTQLQLTVIRHDRDRVIIDIATVEEERSGSTA